MPIAITLEELSTLLGDRLSRSKSDLAEHGRSESYFSARPPDAVAYPRTTEEVSAILRICNAHGCPVVGWGAGTSIEGNALALKGGVCVDFRLMNAVLQINAEDMDVVVQPGLTREELNIALRDTGLFFPVDPGANASIGGMTSTRASGTTAVRYGTMREQVLALKVVLADGKVIETGTRARKSASGYDLTHLFVGSEGTLGLITEITLRLHGQPEKIVAAVCAFPQMDAAVEAVQATIQMDLPMARIEFLDADTVAACNAYSGTGFPEMPHLMVEFHGTEDGVEHDVQRFGEIVEDMGGAGFEWASQTAERNALWTMRHNAYFAVLASRKGATAVVTDICVPISRLAQAVEETRADIANSPIAGPILGHVGDGNFHAILLVDEENPAELAQAKDLAKRMADRALLHGGTITGEHGIGMGKLDLMASEHGLAWSVMTQIKRSMDPQNILNPGKVVRLAEHN